MFTLTKVLRCGFVASTLGFLFTAGTSSILADDVLTIGSQAPELDIEHWVHDGNGKFKPVTEFQKGKVYVVEFWATWCGPCIASMPHLVETQQKFADKDVQIVSISDEDMETVDKFLAREFKSPKPAGDKASDKDGDVPKTYRELTSAYCLTADPDRSCHKSYMTAAGRNGIPCAFIVGKDQKVEWIGHPMAMDNALEGVVEGTWDRAAFAEQFKEEQAMSLLMAKVMRSARAGKTDEALAFLDEAAALSKSGKVNPQLAMLRIQVLMQGGKAEEAIAAMDSVIATTDLPGLKQQLMTMKVQLALKDPTDKKNAQALSQAYKDFEDNPSVINMIAWTLCEKFESGDLEDKALLKASRAAAEKAAEVASKVSDAATRAAIMDTVAHLQHLDGDTAMAIKTQEKAIDLADEKIKDQLTKFLEKLKEASK